MKKKIRNSNYELMRIISMFLIVLYHVIYHGGILQNCSNPSIKIIFNLIVFLSIIHVNSFVLVSGYFQSTSEFKQAKLWTLINASLFYRVIITIILSTLGYISLSNIEIFREFLPFDTVEYWFIKCYILLYCLSPFLNKAIESFNKKTFQKLILVLFILVSILPSISGGTAFDNSGYTLYNFVFLYFIGAYFRKFPVKDVYIFKPMSNRLFQIILVFIFISSYLLNYLICQHTKVITDVSGLHNELIKYINYASLSYSNPLIIIQSVAYFTLFGTLNIKSKIINKVASATIGIYLIHDNNFIRKLIPQIFNINANNVYNYPYVLKIVVIAIIIFTVCLAIELLRQIIFKFVYNRKISNRIREYYYNFIKEIYIRKEEAN